MGKLIYISNFPQSNKLPIKILLIRKKTPYSEFLKNFLFPRREEEGNLPYILI